MSQQARKTTAIVKAATVQRLAIRVAQLAAGVLWIASTAGTIAALNGGWPAPLGTAAGVSWRAVLIGLAVQAVLTVFEYGYAKRRSSILWWGPFAADVAATYLGYSVLLIEPFTARFAGAGVGAAAPWAAHALLLVLCGFIAYIPEATFVE